LRRGEHATQQWRRLARILPPAFANASSAGAPAAAVAAVADSPGGCRLEVSEQQRRDLHSWRAQRRLLSTPLIAIQVGNKRTMRRGPRRFAVNHKYWPHERWAEVLRHLRMACPAHAIVLLGTGPEYVLNREIAVRADVDGVHNVADDMPIPRLVALLAQVDGLITVDSGPAHAAAAVGCPLVVLFGKASTTLYRPWGSAGADVKILTGEVGGEASMLGIKTADVIAAWDALELRISTL
jgi:heptosyltransferase-2/heptosyltransferase-3